MRVIERIFNGTTIKKVVVDARIETGLTTDSKPRFLDNEKMTEYHWVDVAILDAQGHEMQRGAAIVWDKRFKENPARYMEGKTFPVEITLTGPGAGVAQEHMSSGRFDLEAMGITLEDVSTQVVPKAEVI